MVLHYSQRCRHRQAKRTVLIVQHQAKRTVAQTSWYWTASHKLLQLAALH
jgi:hypothetical protein